MRLYLDRAKEIRMKVVQTGRGDALQVELKTEAGLRIFALTLPKQRDAVLLLNDTSDDGNSYAGLQVYDLQNGEVFFTLYLPSKYADAMAELQKQLIGEKPLAPVVVG